MHKETRRGLQSARLASERKRQIGRCHNRQHDGSARKDIEETSQLPSRHDPADL